MGDLAGTIDKVLANGEVALMSGEQKIACENLVVVFGEGQRGRVPNQAFARGHVRISEGQRMIEAEEILATMEERPATVTTQPTTPEKKDLLVALIKPREKTSGLARIILREVEASGDVRIDDPDRQMKVESDRLKCRFDGEGTITWCYLEGSNENWASAESKGNLISGEQVTMDLKTEYAEVPGAGQMQFVSDRDIDGSTYGRSQPVLISWAESMAMEGGERNQGVFTGDVKVVSDNTVMKCQQVLIDFETAPETATKPAKATLADRFPIFERIVGEKRIKSKTVKLPIAKKRPAYIRALPVDGGRIQIENRVDEKNTVLTRTTLNGNQLTIDLGARRMNVPADGYLVIEDYRLPKATAASDRRSASALRDPFGMDMSSRGPSQTAFTWKNGLTYMLDTRTAIFDGDVWMGHESGEGVLAEMRKQQAAEASKSSTSQPASAPAPSGEVAVQDGASAESKKSKATLSCENLLAEFIRGPFGPGGEKSKSRAGAAELSRVVATGSVNLADGKRSAMGRQLRYDNQQKLILIYGTDDTPAYIEMEESDGKYTTYSGPMVSYNRATGRVEARDATITLVR
jgi:lipopolysaccharide assembly outer membrane protein LptD (OstA)